MLARLYKFLLNRGNIAPALPEGMPCCVPGCDNKATEQWFPSFCSLREAGVKITWLHVCAEHDVELNENQVRLLFGSQYDRELARYRQSRLTSQGRAMFDAAKEEGK